MRLLLFLLFLNTSIAFAAPVEVTVDRNPAFLNESFEITFTATEDPDGEPDFSPLEQDFEIISRNHNTSLSIINGNASKQLQWTFTVMAKKTGDVTIPALNFGSASSLELVITVNDRQATTDSVEQTTPILFLEVEASPKKPYLQSQVIYTLRFFRRVNIAEASLKELELDDAMVERLGEDKNYKTRHNGMAYAVTERRYAVFPQKSGKMIIEPMELTAAVLDYDNSRFGGFFGSRSTRRERVKSDAITLDVQPVPADFKGRHWLAASNVKLVQKWSGDSGKMQVGEPLTRTLTLMVNGATVGQLPALQKSHDVDGLKNYPDQPVLQDKKLEDGIIALREEKIAFIPSKAGTYTLPEISIDWFNTLTGKMETAKIPETVVTAIGGAVGTVDKAQQDEVAVNTENVESVTEKTTVSPNTASVNDNGWLWPGLSAFFASGWLVTLFLLFKKKTQSSETESNEAEIRLKDCVAALKKACAANDSQAAKQALLDWGRLQYGCNSLGVLANHCDEDLRDEILFLNRSLYGQQTLAWDGEKLYQAFKKHDVGKKTSRQENAGELEPLYKI